MFLRGRRTNGRTRSCKRSIGWATGFFLRRWSGHLSPFGFSVCPTDEAPLRTRHLHHLHLRRGRHRPPGTTCVSTPPEHVIGETWTRSVRHGCGRILRDRHLHLLHLRARTLKTTLLLNSRQTLRDLKWFRGFFFFEKWFKQFKP